MKNFIVATLVVALAALAFGANGEKGEPLEVMGSGYQADKQTSVFRSAVASADTITSDATVIAIHTPFSVRGRPNFSVSARFSAASKTCVVTVFLLAVKSDGTYYIKDRWADTTLTGPATTYGTSYMAPSYVFDTLGATHVIVAVTTAPTGGATVDIGAGSS